MSEQQVFVNPGAYSQGVNTAIAQQNTNLGTLKGFYNMGTEINKRNDFSNLYNQAAENNTQPTWEQIEQVYAKYGDTEGMERAKEQAYKRDVNQFGIKAKHYFDQAEKAYNTGNDDALFTVQKMVNDDPVITKFMDKVTFMPNNQIEYTVKKDQDILMDGGVIKKASAGDKIVAYRGEDENGQPRFYATKIEPTSMSTAIQRGKSTGGSGRSAKNPLSFNKEIDKLVSGKGVFSDELYSDAIQITENPVLAHNSYMGGKNLIKREQAEGYYNDAVYDEANKYVDKAYRQRLKKDLTAWKETKKVKDAIRQGATSNELMLEFMKDQGIPSEDFNEIYRLVFGSPQKKIEISNNDQVKSKSIDFSQLTNKQLKQKALDILSYYKKQPGFEDIELGMNFSGLATIKGDPVADALNNELGKRRDGKKYNKETNIPRSPLEYYYRNG